LRLLIFKYLLLSCIIALCKTPKLVELLSLCRICEVFCFIKLIFGETFVRLVENNDYKNLSSAEIIWTRALTEDTSHRSHKSKNLSNASIVIVWIGFEVLEQRARMHWPVNCVQSKFELFNFTKPLVVSDKKV
jgi:hypothetical protein